jgi:hypothetical protein
MAPTAWSAPANGSFFIWVLFGKFQYGFVFISIISKF